MRMNLLQNLGKVKEKLEVSTKNIHQFNINESKKRSSSVLKEHTPLSILPKINKDLMKIATQGRSLSTINFRDISTTKALYLNKINIFQ